MDGRSQAQKMLPGGRGTARQRGRRGCFYYRRDMGRQTFPSPALRGRDGGSGAVPPHTLARGVDGCGGLDQVQNALLDLVGELFAFTAALAQFTLDACACLTHLALDAHPGLADLALKAIAGGDASALELA